MRKKADPTDAIIEELLEMYGRSPEGILGEKGLFSDLKKKIVEKPLLEN